MPKDYEDRVAALERELVALRRDFVGLSPARQRGREAPEDAAHVSEHAYFIAIEQVVSNVQLTVAIQLNLLDSVAMLRSAYFLHIIMGLVALFFVSLTLRNTLQSWAHTGTSTLRALWYEWLLRLVNLTIAVLSVAVVQATVVKFGGYIRTGSGLDVNLASRLLIAFAMFAWILQVYKYMLMRPKAVQSAVAREHARARAQ